MGRLKNDIAILIDDSYARGADGEKIAMRLIEAGIRMMEDEGKTHRGLRIVPNLTGDGSYHLARFVEGKPAFEKNADDPLSNIAHLKAALGGNVQPGWSYVVRVGGDDVSFTVTATHDDPREALRAAGEQFLAYRDSHAAKHTPDGDAKARTNERMAAMCYQALGCDDWKNLVANSPDYMLALVPVADDEASFHHVVATLVENGYERGVAHDEMMRGLAKEIVAIGQAHGWNDGASVWAEGLGSDGSDHALLAGDAVGPQIRPVEADSGDFRTIVVPASVGALLRESDEPLSRRELVAYLVGKAEVATRTGNTDLGNTLQALAAEIAQHMEELPINVEAGLREFFRDTHARNRKAGWWSDLATGKPKKRSVGELLMLHVTEIAEAYDAYIMRANDDKLPQYPGFGVELGDLLIRLGDIAGAAAAGHLVEYSGVDNIGDQMFREVVGIANRYEAIRKTPAAKGAEETGEPIEPMDIATMVTSKLAYNATRADHKPENRLKEGGKVT